MNIGNKSIAVFLIAACLAGLDLMPVGHVEGQTFSTLHGFTATSASFPYTNSDGANPYGAPTLAGNTLYGTASAGGSAGKGTVFKFNPGGGLTVLHSFTGSSNGASPSASVILSNNTLYGTTEIGGNAGYGTVFKVDTDGTGFATLYSFLGTSDGSYPYVGVTLSGNTLYGTTGSAGTDGKGTLFKLNIDGSGFSVLHNFSGAGDGASPLTGLIVSGDSLYGAAQSGGIWGKGTVFKLNTNGTAFTTLYNFGGSDGFSPSASLVLSGNTLYGATVAGGSLGNGTVFAVNTDGTGFRNVYSFTGGNDGGNPYAGVIISGPTLYGTTTAGGDWGGGTAFRVNTNGTGFGTLYSFTAASSPPYTNSDGTYPVAGLALSGNTLYGTALNGGNWGAGTVFEVSIAPRLTIIPSAAKVIITWPTNAFGYALQSTTNVMLTTGWSTVSTIPVVVNGQNTVTNTAAGTVKFYRLIK